MTLALTALALDHRRGDPQAPTLPLSYDERSAVSVPEWVIGTAGEAPVAFIRDRLLPTVAVLARFAGTADEPGVVEVRALAASDTVGSTLLPDLPATLVPLSRGDSGWVPFLMPTASLSAAGVAAAHCVWRWQVRRAPATPWHDIIETPLRIYVVLRPPTAPWQSLLTDGDLTCLPTVAALEVACAWAAGAADVGEAGRRITRAVYGLGKATLSYDALFGAPHYTVLGVARFLLRAFLDRLSGGEGAGPLVNCSDCATIVSTFANLLGEDLWQSKMGLVAPQFRLNPIRSIGSPSWSRLWGGFGFHEVAWSGACGESDRVFDACLEVDADSDPTKPPHTPLLPVDERFGTPGSGDYRDRLTAPADRALCAPQPTLRIRRAIVAQIMPWTLATAEPAAASQQDGTTWFIDGFTFFGRELPGWRLSRQDFVAALAPPPGDASAGNGRVIVSWWRAAMPAGPMARIESFEMPSSSAAATLLANLRTEFERPQLETSGDSSIGDASIATADGALVMFRRGNHVHVVRPAGLQPIDAPAVGRALDNWLTSAVGADPPGSVSAPQGPPAGSFGPFWRRLALRGAAARRDATGIRLDAMPGAVAAIEERLIVPTSRIQAQRPDGG